MSLNSSINFRKLCNEDELRVVIIESSSKLLNNVLFLDKFIRFEVSLRKICRKVQSIVHFLIIEL